MVSLADLERPRVRVILAAALLLEVYLIATRFHAGFEEFLTLAALLLALPLAYYAVRFIRERTRTVGTYEAVLRPAIPWDASEETRV
jgi:hypothetical protein